MTAMSHRPRRRSDRRLLLTSAGLVSVAFVIGCEVRGVIGSNLTGYETDGIQPEPGTSGDGDGDAGDETATLLDVGDTGIMSWGEYWCVRAEGATYDDPLLGTIVITDSDGGAAEGCECIAFNTAVHNWILENEVDDEVVIEQVALEAELGVGALLVSDLLAARDEIYLDARNSCTDLVPGTATADTCEDPELFDTDPLTPELDPRAIYRGNLDGEIECIPPPVPSSSSCAFCDDPSGIQLSHGVYDVPEAIFEGFITRPHCLMAQGWGIRIGNDAFVLHGVTRGDVLARMGLASGDEFVSISAGGDRIALTTGEAAMQAYATMAAENSFSVTIKRGSNTLVRQYQIVP